MFKTGAALVVSLGCTGFLWGWTSSQFTDYQARQNARFAYVQRHQGDALQSVLCYLERRTLRSRTVSLSQKIQSLRTLDRIDRVGHLAPCKNLPPIRR